MTVSLERPHPREARAAPPPALLALYQIRDQVIAPELRLAMLRDLKDEVDAIQSVGPRSGFCAGRPRDAGGFTPSAGTANQTPALTRSLTPEQRVICSWCGNLQRLLVDLGQPRYAGQASFGVYREWVLRQLLKGLGNAVESAVRTGESAPPGTWKSLHDLFVYLDGRDELAGTAAYGRAGFHPEVDYKRLLLMGALAEYVSAARILEAIGPRLREWAFDSQVRPDVRVVGESALLRLTLSEDAPPRHARPGDAQPYNGWVLEPAQAYTDYLADYALRARRKPVLIF
ncbi:hypothetical protein [Lamprocystis purpurea]|jgi:hypothetical protein|uniref:hypothetical protein n=1 Tax=Lamprocystis purpurea TaxID=61598 RepID=UPI0003600A3D|nr:hypothetical protein [Lamprocystis purpurea]